MELVSVQGQVLVLAGVPFRSVVSCHVLASELTIATVAACVFRLAVLRRLYGGTESPFLLPHDCCLFLGLGVYVGSVVVHTFSGGVV